MRIMRVAWDEILRAVIQVIQIVADLLKRNKQPDSLSGDVAALGEKSRKALPIPKLPDNLFTPKWFNIAKEELGVSEYMGPCSNPRVEEYHSSVEKNERTPDHVPWCASFVCWCLEKAKVKHPRSMRAKSFLLWGEAVTGSPSVGDICVFSRGGGGHVGFYHSETATDVFVLGGNQGDKVSITNFPKTRLIGIRRLK